MIKECSNCEKEMNLEIPHEVFKISIPDDVILRIGLETMSQYYSKPHEFCSERCYNIAVLDELINGYEFSLLLPEDNFLSTNYDEDILKAKNTLKRLREFKENYIK